MDIKEQIQNLRTEMSELKARCEKREQDQIADTTRWGELNRKVGLLEAELRKPLPTDAQKRRQEEIRQAKRDLKELVGVRGAVMCTDVKPGDPIYGMLGTIKKINRTMCVVDFGFLLGEWNIGILLLVRADMQSTVDSTPVAVNTETE